jgi:predicted site-specific integrase-resolvase
MLQLKTASDLANDLQVDASTIYRWATEKKIPSVRLAKGVVRFEPTAIALWVSNKTEPARTRPTASSTAKLRERIRAGA